MPLIFRVMTPDGNKPKVGDTARTLGVRVPPNPNFDIDVNPDGTVEPGRGGMSVSPTLEALPLFRVPKRLACMIEGATGKDEDCCWSMADGPFEDGPLTAELAFRKEHKYHGFIEPAYRMSMADYLAALAATRDGWRLEG